MKRILVLLFLSITSLSFSQNTIERKTLKAVRIDYNPTIDGKLDEAFWQNADIARDFVMIEPGDGDPERPSPSAPWDRRRWTSGASPRPGRSRGRRHRERAR